MKNIKSHQRILDTFTGPLERPLLRWLASKMPAWISPDILTGIGVLGGVLILASYALTNIHPAFLWLATLGFVINWFGDSLDGTLARYRKIEKPIYGFYIDHVVDLFVEIMIFLGIGLSPYVRFDLACLALIGYLALSAMVYIRTCLAGEFVLSYSRLGPTEARLIAVGANAIVWFAGGLTFSIFWIQLTIFDCIAIFVIFLLAAIILSTAIRQGKLFARLEATEKSHSTQ